MNKTTKLIVQTVTVCLGVSVLTAAANAQNCAAIPILTIGEHTLDFSENQPVCVTPDGTFEIYIETVGGYSLNYNDVSVKQKKGFTKIKKDDVNSQGVMTVEVGKFTIGAEPKYKITVKNVGVLDPRVRIIPAFHLLHENYAEIEEYLLDEYLLSLSGLDEIEQYLNEGYDMSITDILQTIQAAREHAAD